MKPKGFFKTIVFTIATIFLSALGSCSNSAGTGSISVSMNPSRIIQYTGGGISKSETVQTYTILAELTGDFSEKKEVSVSENQNSCTFDFEEIPAGAKINVKISLKSGDETLKSGESGIFTVKPGKNEIKITLKYASGTSETSSSEDETLWVILWNRAENEGSENTGLTVGFNLFKEISGVEKIDSKSISTNKLEHFCFAENGDLYTIESYEDTTGETIYNAGQYIKNDDGFENGGFLDLSEILGDYEIQDIECYNDDFYMILTSSETETKIAFFNISNFNSNFNEYESISVYSVNGIQFSKFAIFNDAFFLTNGGVIYKIDLAVLQNNPSTSFNDNWLFCSLPTPSINSEITDIFGQGNYLCGICADKTNKQGGVFRIYYQEGGIGTWQNGETFFGLKEESSDKTYENNFYFPTKFIAVSKKKLVIADDGFIEEDTAEDTKENKNRVVEIDLESETFSAKDVGVMFDYMITACGFTKAGDN